jgi:tripartite-type tricarboxylate transporter receptor subunit TctC
LRVAKSPPDGYQFVLGNVGTHAQNQSLHANPPYNAAADFVPAALLVDQSMLLAVRKDLPGRTLAEFIGHARANQAKMQYGSAGAGSPTHLACALLNAAIGIEVTHIPYRGGGPAMQDLIAGRIDYFCFNTASILPHIESGAVKAIAMLSRERSPAVPALASAHEQGLQDFEVGNWLAFFFPKGTPEPIVRRLHEAAARALSNPAVQEKLKQLGADPIPPERRAPEKLQGFIDSEIAKWAAIIRKANIRMD